MHTTEPMPFELHQSRATRHREIPGMSARRVPRGIRGVAGRARAHRLRRGAVVDGSPYDTALDKGHAALRRAFHIEGDRERARIERVLDERECLAGHLL